MQLRTVQHYPLPNDLQDIVFSYLPKEDKPEKFKPTTVFIAMGLTIGMMWPLMMTVAHFIEGVPLRFRYSDVIVEPGPLLVKGGLILVASVPIDAARYVIPKISAKIKNIKNQHWASFFVDVERTPKNIHHIMESRKRKRE